MTRAGRLALRLAPGAIVAGIGLAFGRYWWDGISPDARTYVAGYLGTILTIGGAARAAIAHGTRGDA